MMQKPVNDLMPKRKTHDQLTNLPSLNEDDKNQHLVKIQPESTSAEYPENSVRHIKAKPGNKENVNLKIISRAMQKIQLVIL